NQEINFNIGHLMFAITWNNGQAGNQFSLRAFHVALAAAQPKSILEQMACRKVPIDLPRPPLKPGKVIKLRREQMGRTDKDLKRRT
ncbi:MAG: hypothetical protein ACP5VS_13770, partial [Desulfomonilaceae bacterium]